MCEGQQRAHCMKPGFAEIGFFWYTCNSPSALRSVFIAKVYSQSVSGLTAFAWTQADSNVVQNAWRRRLHNNYWNETMAKDEEGVVVCNYTDRQLPARFYLARHHVEVRAQRL